MAIIDGLKSAADVLRKADKIDEFNQILNAQAKMLEMQNRIAELEQENKKLKEALVTDKKLTAKNNVYWTEEGEQKDGPFCTGCWDSDRKLIRLHTSSLDWVKCPACKTNTYAGDKSQSRTKIGSLASKF